MKRSEALALREHMTRAQINRMIGLDDDSSTPHEDVENLINEFRDLIHTYYQPSEKLRNKIANAPEDEKGAYIALGAMQALTAFVEKGPDKFGGVPMKLIKKSFMKSLGSFMKKYKAAPANEKQAMMQRQYDMETRLFGFKTKSVEEHLDASISIMESGLRALAEQFL